MAENGMKRTFSFHMNYGLAKNEIFMVDLLREIYWREKARLINLKALKI